jgi:hypothetical protein
MVKERRLFVRFLMSGIVVLQLDPKKPEMINCELIDLSYDGVGMYSPQQLNVNTKVKFLLINRQLNVNIGGMARVAYCNPVKYSGRDYFRVGMEFSEVDREQIKAILKNIQQVS